MCEQRNCDRTVKMSRIETGCLVLILLLVLVTSSFSQNLIVGYYPSWMKSTLPAEDIQFDNLTHIIHAFVWPDAAGNIIVANDFLYPELNDAVHNAGKKILITFGGAAQSGGFAQMAADPTSRAAFVENVVEFVQNNQYDGVDLDWESPRNVSDKNNLTLLVNELREKFNEVDSSLLLTMAVSAGSWFGQHHDYQAMLDDIDWYGIMAYDFHGGWTNHAGHNAPLYQAPGETDGSCNTALQYLHITRGIPKEKLLLGIPFYGKHFFASSLYGPATGGNTTYLYSEIVAKIAAGGWIYHWDDVSKVPYLFNDLNNRFITYDDTMSVRLKCEFAQDKEMLGVMIWALGQDVVDGSQPLLESIGKSMLGQTGIDLSQNHDRKKIHLYHNFPNPFNPTTQIQFFLDRARHVKLTIYNSTGQIVQTLTNSIMQKGLNRVEWNASGMATGIYFYRLDAGDFSEMNKMLLVR